MAICGASDKIFEEKIIMNAEQALIELLWRKKYNVAFPAKLYKASLFEGNRFSETAKYDDIELMPRILGGAQTVAYHGLPKYTFERHSGNNSAWTTNHSLLDSATLSEYLAVYRSRTQWLEKAFPAQAAAWRYFEWSFLISMVEKVKRLNLSECQSQAEAMVKTLKAHRNEFMSSPLIQDFEKAWLEQYIT